MAIPRFNDIFTEVLQVLERDGVTHRRELMTRMVEMMDLTEEERAATFPGGTNIARNRVHWALEFLCQAGAAHRPKRGFAAITDLGKELLRDPSGRVTLSRLRETEGMKAWKERSRQNKIRRRQGSGQYEESDGDSESGTPMERIEASITELEAAVGAEMLDRIKGERPEFLEKAVLRLLHAMGYGNSEDDLEHLGGSGDGGVDGVVNQDALGLEQIYIQAKRNTESAIGRPAVQGFVGALAGKHAVRGVFITTSTFSREAREFVENLKDTRVILIDGDELARLMIRFKVGVTIKHQFEVPEIDENFFED